MEVRVGTAVVLVEIPDGRHDLPLGGLISFRTPEVQLHPCNP
ncbi:hypothetical protein [Lentzea roselyniae]